MSLTKENFPQGPTKDNRNENISISSELRSHRMAKNIEITTASQVLRIRRDYLIALENGDVDKMPERVYTLGFVRAYARYLGLDIDVTLQRFKEEILAEPQAPVYTLPKPLNENTKPHRWVILLSACLGAGVLGAWFFFFNNFSSPSQPVVPVEIKQAFKEAAAPLKQETRHESAPGETLVISATKSLYPSLTKDPKEGKQEPEKDAVTRLENSHGARPEAASVSPHTSLLALPATKASASFNATSFLEFIEPSWVEVKDTQGRLVQKRLFQAGERLAPYPYTVDVTVGNAGGVQLSLQGKITRLGKRGEVIRNFRLSSKEE